jgi:hypothetical protein
MTLFLHLNDRLTRAVGNNQDNDPDDVRLIKRNLNSPDIMMRKRMSRIMLILRAAWMMVSKSFNAIMV